MYFFYQNFNLPLELLTQFYLGDRHSGAQDRLNDSYQTGQKRVTWTARTAKRITGALLPSHPGLKPLQNEKTGRKKIISDTTHSGHNLFELLPCGRGYRSLSTRKPNIRAVVSTGHLSHKQLTLGQQASFRSYFHFLYL